MKKLFGAVLDFLLLSRVGFTITVCVVMLGYAAIVYLIEA